MGFSLRWTHERSTWARENVGHLKLQWNHHSGNFSTTCPIRSNSPGHFRTCNIIYIYILSCTILRYHISGIAMYCSKPISPVLHHLWIPNCPPRQLCWPCQVDLAVHDFGRQDGRSADVHPHAAVGGRQGLSNVGAFFGFEKNGEARSYYQSFQTTW